MRRCPFQFRLFATIALLCACAHAASAITIPTVRVGDVGNPNDPATGNLYGGVSYAYRMGTTEVTVEQYTAFLNAVAATDTYGLYNTLMATDLNSAGVARSGSSGSYSYSVIGSPNHPVTYVSWADAARFANWLQNSRPNGAQGPGTTETGAYNLNGAKTEAALMAVTRNAVATWFIPTESEWYKAAYFQPAAHGGDADSYWNYPTRSNSAPYSDQPPGATPDNTRVANYYNNDFLPNGYNDGYAVTGSSNYVTDPTQNYLTDVGAYSSSASYYGTYDQGGNVSEWNDAVVSLSNRGLRGASWHTDSAGTLAASHRSFADPLYASSNVGFRVATVPEPPGIAIAAVGLAGLLAYGRCRWSRRKSDSKQ